MTAQCLGPQSESQFHRQISEALQRPHRRWRHAFQYNSPLHDGTIASTRDVCWHSVGSIVVALVQATLPTDDVRAVGVGREISSLDERHETPMPYGYALQTSERVPVVERCIAARHHPAILEYSITACKVVLCRCAHK